MKKSNLIILILITLKIGIIIGALGFSFIENKLMKDYDLYNCIYNNADSNNFNQNPVMIQKIQDECVCFREHNYTNLLEVNCSK
jgi:hypothetical protein